MSEARQPERQAARAALIQARDVGAWGTKNLTRNRKRTIELVAELEPLKHEPEVVNLLDRIRRDPTRIDSRELHYIQRRYQDGEYFRDMGDMDARYGRVLSDPNALVYRVGGQRYQVRSPSEGWICICEADGTRVSLYPDLDDDFGAPLWTLSDLIP